MNLDKWHLWAILGGVSLAILISTVDRDKTLLASIAAVALIYCTVCATVAHDEEAGPTDAES